jgi:hypothetical protein
MLNRYTGQTSSEWYEAERSGSPWCRSARYWRAGQRAKLLSLLNNAPLAELVRRLVAMERLPDMPATGHPLALAASGYIAGCAPCPTQAFLSSFGPIRQHFVLPHT